MSKPAAPGQLRIAPHTDYGTITILRADNSPGGSLQVSVHTCAVVLLAMNNRDPRWVTSIVKKTDDIVATAVKS